MICLDLNIISNITNGVLFGDNLKIHYISIDTRNKKYKKYLFIALKGKNIDAHTLCLDAINSGAIALLVEFLVPVMVPQLIVKDTNKALGEISRWLRINSNVKVFAVTGSTGKTTVKEMMVNILRYSGNNVLYTYGNLNNNIGVPLTLLNLNNSFYKYVILELGVSCINDMKYLANIVLPDIALVTNISFSHFISFKSFYNIVKTKGLIFNYLKKNGIAVINKDIKYLSFWNKYLLEKNMMFYSFRKKLGVDVFLLNLDLKDYGSYLTIYTFLGVIKIFLRLLGIHNIFNILASISCSISLGISLKDIIIGLESFLPVKGRLYPIYLNKYKLILDDTYNSNPRSVYYSVLFLSRFSGYKVLIISDMAELGKFSIRSHINIGFVVRNLYIDKVFSIGFHSFYISKYSLVGEHFIKISDLIIRLKYILMLNSKVTVLIKGSRVFNMDKIISFL